MAQLTPLLLLRVLLVLLVPKVLVAVLDLL